jgi:hypothetical protein
MFSTCPTTAPNYSQLLVLPTTVLQISQLLFRMLRVDVKVCDHCFSSRYWSTMTGICLWKPPLDQHLQLDQDLVDVTLPAHFFTHDADVCTSDLGGRALVQQKTHQDPSTFLLNHVLSMFWFCERHRGVHKDSTQETFIIASTEVLSPIWSSFL